MLIVHSADYKCCVLCVLYRSPDTFADLYVVFECMDLDLDKLGKDTRQSLSLDHVRWFMYEVRCLLVCVHACPVHWTVWCVRSAWSVCCGRSVCSELYASDASHHHLFATCLHVPPNS